MIKITIIALGKLKEKYLRDAVDEYSKRLSRYCKLNIVELEPVRLNDNPSKKQIDIALEQEGEKILNLLSDNTHVISMCIEGEHLSSEQFAEHINKVSVQNTSSIAFIIGSSFGLCNKIKQISAKKLSFSKMTFPHQLARVMLLEQVYRAFKITEGSDYHK